MMQGGGMSGMPVMQGGIYGMRPNPYGVVVSNSIEPFLFLHIFLLGNVCLMICEPKYKLLLVCFNLCVLSCSITNYFG